MDLLEKTKKICKEYNIHPARSKGQNFLINEDVYDKIVEAGDLKKTDTVLEVGPGLGFLTAKLAEKAGQVIAVELDDELASYLRGNLKNKNIEIINENILDIDVSDTRYKIQDTKYKVIANLPYNITSIFLRKMLIRQNKPSEMILMLQKEVAERICAKPGDMSLLALSVQFYSDPEILFYVPRTDFYPSPEVDSAVIRLSLRAERSNPEVFATNTGLPSRSLGSRDNREKEFFRLAKIGFSAKRKMLKNNLANGLHISNKEAEEILARVNLDLRIRAEDLGIEDWIRLLPFCLAA